MSFYNLGTSYHPRNQPHTHFQKHVSKTNCAEVPSNLTSIFVAFVDFFLLLKIKWNKMNHKGVKQFGSRSGPTFKGTKCLQLLSGASHKISIF